MGAQLCESGSLAPCVCDSPDTGARIDAARASVDDGGADSAGSAIDAANAEDAGGRRDGDDAAASADAEVVTDARTDSDTAMTDRDAGSGTAMDASGGIDASAAADTGTGADTGAVADAGGVTDAAADAAADAGAGSTTIDEWAGAYRAWAAAYCACSWAALGYTSVAACESERGLSSAILACARSSFVIADASVALHFGCTTAAYSEATSCHLAVAACDTTAVADCELRLDVALDTCVAPSSYATFLASVSACSRGVAFCPDSRDTFGGTGDAIFTGTTVGAADHYTSSCGAPATNDRVHLWGAFFDNVYVFDTEGSTFDTVLYVIDAGESLMCVAGAELACNDDAMPGRPSSRVELYVEVLPRVLVVVEGRDPLHGGNYQVNIRAVRGL